MKRRGRGQGLVEFALVLPTFLLLFFGTVDLGRGIWAMDVGTHAAAEAGRFAIVHGGSAIDGCPVGPPVAGVTVIPLASAACPNPSPSKQAIYDVATNAAIASGGVPTVTVCYGLGCVGDIDTTNNARGQPVTVRVTVHVHLFTGSLLGISDFALTSTSTMVVNN